MGNLLSREKTTTIFEELSPESAAKQSKESGEELCHESQIESIQIAAQRTSSIQIPKSFANPPPEILEQIFIRIPAEERLVVAAVCRSWRAEFLKTLACWRGIRLGRNANWYWTMPPALHRADFFPLTHVEEIQFMPAIPAVMQRAKVNPDAEEFWERWETVGDQLKEMPLEWLSLVLQHASSLQRLDLSAMVVDGGRHSNFQVVFFFLYQGKVSV